MTVKYKVSDFAKDLSISAKKVLDELNAMGSTGKKNSSNLEENELNYLLEKFSKAGSVKDLDEFLNSAKAPKEEPKPAEKKAEKKTEKKPEAPKAEEKPKAKRGRKPGTKNTTAPKTQPLAAAQPADLRRLAAVLEEIADLEAQTAKLDTLRTEAEELKNRLTAKQA